MPPKHKATCVALLALLVMATAGAASPAVAAYRSDSGASGLDSPKVRFWDSAGNGSWGPEMELASAGSPVRWAQIRWAPSSEKLVLVILADDGNLDGYVCMAHCDNASSWLMSGNIGNTGNSQRRFDVAFEGTGDAILVYSVISTNGSRDLAYKVLPAGAGTFDALPERYIDDAGHAGNIQYTWVRMDGNPALGDELALVGFDNSNSDINAWIWDGDAWGAQKEVSSGATATSGSEALAVRYGGGMAMAMGANGTAGAINYAYWNGSAWSGTSSFDIDGSDALDARWLSLKPSPGDDAFQLVVVDSGSDLHTAYWNGTGWPVTSNIDTALDSASQRGADFGWLDGGSGLLVWDTDGSGQNLSMKECTPQCSGTARPASGFPGAGRWLTLIPSGDSGLLGLRLSSGLALGHLTYDASAMSGQDSSALSASLGSASFESFSLASAPRPAVSVLKLDQTALQPSPGGLVLFNITVTNRGNLTLDEVIVTDYLPDGLAFASSDAAGNVSGQNATWLLGPLSPSASATILLNATIDEGLLSGGLQYADLENRVDVSAQPSFGSSINASGTAAFRIFLAEITLMELDQTALQPSPGGMVELEFSLSNSGSVPLENVTLSSQLPAGLTYASASQEPATSEGGAVVWLLGTLSPGESVSVHMNGSVDEGVVDASSPLATLTSCANASGRPPNGRDAITVACSDIAVYHAGISVIKVDVTPLPPSPGGLVQWAINVSNAGLVELYQVSVSDSLPEGFAFNAARPSPALVDGGTVVWENLGPLAPGESVTILLNTTAGSGLGEGVYDNTASATGSPPNGADVSDSDTASVGILAPSITLAKTADRTDAELGRKVGFTLLISNTGSATLDVSALDMLPEGVALSGSSPAPTSQEGRELRWDSVAMLEPGQNVTIQYNVTAGRPGWHVNAAEAIGSPLNGDAVSDFAEASFFAYAVTEEERLALDFAPSCDGNAVAATADGLPLGGAAITVKDRGTGETLSSGATDSGGSFLFHACGGKIEIRARKAGYSSEVISRTLLSCDECIAEAAPLEEPDEQPAPALPGEGITQCMIDEDCPAESECVLDESAGVRSCREITGCGTIIDHTLVPYECGNGPSCPLCPEGYVCDTNICLKLKKPEPVIVTEPAEQVSAPPSIVASSRSEELPITRGIPGLMAVLGACLGLVIVAIIHVEIDKGKGPAEP
ncbi:MAG: hypothetical protein AB1529_05880 [Candidatus Micrarchaeota archaeon]